MSREIISTAINEPYRDAWRHLQPAEPVRGAKTMAKESLDYEPLALDEQKEAFKRDEPVQTRVNKKDDPVNIRTDDEIRKSPG